MTGMSVSLEAMNRREFPLFMRSLCAPKPGRAIIFITRKIFYKIVASYDTLPEAIVCGNDNNHRQNIRQNSFREIACACPEDAALTGFDDMTRTGRRIRSSPTVHVDTKRAWPPYGG